ncbi:MAG TPA: HAMP domain-containing sensor histidine kinase [Bacteroidia bacterium]|nr:HAMP domain-containing sensor histidine kinase [Bacteroidia bacterium]
MKLQVKLAIYNALSKGIIIAAFGFLLPLIVERVVYDHIDKRLIARTDRVLKIISRGGLNEIIMEQDCSFESYTILKEEFVSIKPLANDMVAPETLISNERWDVGGEKLNHRIIHQAFVFDNQLYELRIGEGLSTIDQLKSTIVQFSLWLMIIVTIISVFIDIGFVRLMMIPFNKIVRQKLQLAGNPSAYKFDPIHSTTSEFNHLDTTINELMRRTRDAFLIEKEFIANVAHELLTPISILQHRLENMIVNGEVPLEFENKILDSQKTLGRLSKIIRALLMISKIENDQYLKQERVYVSQLAGEVLDEMIELIEEKKIILQRSLADSPEFGPCNKTLLFTMIFNIVNNAIKYNNIGGTISVTGHLEPDSYVLEIADSGIGIDPEKLDHIFNRFERFHPGDGPGYGLGLPIVKTIADFHRIKLDVHSKPMQGTTFVLSFPLNG